jgi:vitamin B12 transporter
MDSRGGGYQFAQLNPALIGFFEVNSGIGSAFDGSGVLGGVVSIGFERAKDNQLNLRLNASLGSFGFQEYGVGTYFQDTQWSISSKLTTVREDDRFEGSEYENHGGFLKLSYAPSDDDFLGMAVWYGDTERTLFPDDSGGPLYAELREYDRFVSKDFGLSVRHIRKISEGLSWHSMAGFYHLESDASSSGVSPGLRNPFGVPENAFDDQFRRVQMESYFKRDPDESINWVVGLQVKLEDADSEGSVLFPFGAIPADYEQSKSLYSAFGEFSWAIAGNQMINVGLRLDKYDYLDAELSPSAEYSFGLNDGFAKFFFRYDRGFKAPSFFALNNPLVGNERLSPEFADSFELGIKSDLADSAFRYQLSYFRAEYKDLIDLSEVEQRLVNLDSVKTSGLEMSFYWGLSSDLEVSLNSTFLEFDLQESDEILRFRPSHAVNLRADWKVASSMKLRLSYSYISERWDSSIPTGNVKLGSFHALNATLAVDLMDALRVEFGGYNLLNIEKETSIGYESRGINYRLGLQYEF